MGETQATPPVQPTTPPKSVEDSRKLMENVSKMPSEAQQHPQVQADLEQARQVLQEHVQKLETQKEPLSEAQKKELADAKAALARQAPGRAASIPDTGKETPPADATPAARTQQPEPAVRPEDAARPAEATPESTRRPQPAGAPQTDAPDGNKRPQGEPGNADDDPNGTPHTDTTAEAVRNHGDPQEKTRSADTSPTASTARPSTPPRSVQQSQRLLENVSRLPAQAQQHPTTRADADQARQVVADHVQKLENQSAPLSEGQKKELAEAKATLALTQPRGAASSPQASQFKEAPPSSPSGPGSSLPGSGMPQTPSPGAALPSQQLPNQVRAAISAHGAKFPGLKVPITESALPSGYSSGMWVNPDGSIRYHVPTLAKQLAGMDAQAVGKNIGALVDAHVQATTGQITQTSKPKPPPSAQLAQGIPGQTAPHALSKIKTALDAHTKHWNTLAKDLKSVDSEMNTAVKQGDFEKKRVLEQKSAQLEKEMDKLAEKTRQYVIVPEAARGKVELTHVTPTTAAKALAGAELAQRYTHASLLPTVGVVDYNRNRAGYLHGMVLINSLTSPSHVMHEIAHGIEEQNPRVLKACLDFLRKRAGNESPQLLANLTGNPKYGLERAYKDRFEELGGKHYMGRFYPRGDGTEILTMGIERLHRNPVEFYVNDPEYFEFVIQTLQNP